MLLISPHLSVWLYLFVNKMTENIGIVKEILK